MQSDYTKARWIKQGLAPLLLLFAVTAGGVVTYLHCPGCIERQRVNKTCEWSGDTAFPIDHRNAAHQTHLVADAQLAEELAIRHADAEFGRRFGIEHHGGLLDGGRFRRDCLSRMFRAIETNHDVTSEQVSAARGQRNPTFDLAVGILFLPFFSFGATVACRWLSRRFSSDERSVRLVATALASVAVTFLGVQCFRLFGAVWEVVRVGNGHMAGIRAASYTRWPHQYVGADLMIGILLFWLIALCCYQVASDEHCNDVRRADEILQL